MPRWTAIVPFNFGRPRKTRLSALLSTGERDMLAMAMADHVVTALASAPSIAKIHILSPVDPCIPGTYWIADEGRGLNAELEAARNALADMPALLIHADLPLLTGEDVEALLTAATSYAAAIAPATDGGTNALALAGSRFLSLAFGKDSLVRHKALLPDAPLVERPGLACDVDDEASLRTAVKQGFPLPFLLPASGHIAPPI